MPDGKTIGIWKAVWPRKELKGISEGSWIPDSEELLFNIFLLLCLVFCGSDLWFKLAPIVSLICLHGRSF